MPTAYMQRSGDLQSSRSAQRVASTEKPRRIMSRNTSSSRIMGTDPTLDVAHRHSVVHPWLATGLLQVLRVRVNCAVAGLHVSPLPLIYWQSTRLSATA